MSKKLLKTKFGTEIVLSKHAKRNLKRRDCMYLHKIMNEGVNVYSMVRDLVSTFENTVDKRKIRTSTEDACVFHLYREVNDSIVEQGIILSYKREKNRDKIVVVSYCWQIVAKKDWSRKKSLYCDNKGKYNSFISFKELSKKVVEPRQVDRLYYLYKGMVNNVRSG